MKTQLTKISEKIKGYKVNQLAATVFGVLNPESTLAMEIIKHICSVADECRYNAILQGLSEDNNLECRLNELYNYINSKDRAFFVSETFRKAMLGNSIIACSIMSLILSDNVKCNRDFSQEDMILMRALEHFSDYDLQNVEEIIQGDYYKKLPDGTQCIETSRFPSDKKDTYMLTVDYCIQYRLLIKTHHSIGESLYMDEITVSQQAYRLLEYIKRVHRLIEYRATS